MLTKKKETYHGSKTTYTWHNQQVRWFLRTPISKTSGGLYHLKPRLGGFGGHIGQNIPNPHEWFGISPFKCAPNSSPGFANCLHPEGRVSRIVLTRFSGGVVNIVLGFSRWP